MSTPEKEELIAQASELVECVLADIPSLRDPQIPASILRRRLALALSDIMMSNCQPGQASPELRLFVENVLMDAVEVSFAQRKTVC